MSINITPNMTCSNANRVNYTAAPVAFRANNSTPQTKPMSTENKLLIGGGVVAGTAALVIGAKKGLFGSNIKNKINELFKKFGGDAKAKAEQEAKLKAEKEAQERVKAVSSQNNQTSNNTASATTSTSSSSSGNSNSGGSSSSSSRSLGSTGGSRSRSRRSSFGNTSNNTTGTTTTNANPQPTAQPKPKVTQPPKEILDKINEINAVYADTLKDQPISFIKTFENGEIVTTASVKTEQFIETMLTEVPANVPETLKQELKTALEKELEKLKLVRTGKVDDENMLKEFSDKLNDFFEKLDNNPALSGIKKKIEQWENQVQEETNHILQCIERDAMEAKEAQRKIDIAQAVHTAQGGMRLSGKSAEESAKVFIEQWRNQVQEETNHILQCIERDTAKAKAAQRKIDIAQAVHTAQGGIRLNGKSAEESATVFSEAISKENLNAKRMIQNAYDETMSGRLGHITSKEDAKKYMMQKIEQYVQKCGTFKKVNKNVEINGERINIIYEGIDVDITSEGKLLKKVFVSKPQKAPEMQYENLSKRLADQVEADAEYARRQAQRQRQAQQQRRMLNA